MPAGGADPNMPPHYEIKGAAAVDSQIAPKTIGCQAELA